MPIVCERFELVFGGEPGAAPAAGRVGAAARRGIFAQGRLRLTASLPRLYDRARSTEPSIGGEVAQLVEHMTENHGVDSSILSLATSFFFHFIGKWR